MAKRVKKIFKKWIKEALLARGETLLGVEQNKINTNCIVYVFESRFHISFSVTGKD